MTDQHNLHHPRDEIMHTMERIYRYRMTTTSGGNLSIRDNGGDVWITPARVDKGSLTRNDIVCVKADGSLEGLHRPSSEFPFHQAIYEARPDIRAIVHAHPVALVAFSICRQTPDTRLFPSGHSVCGQRICALRFPAASIGRNIAETFRAGRIASSWKPRRGRGLALTHISTLKQLEFAAKTVIKARQLGDVRYLTPTARTGPEPASESRSV